MFVTLIIRALVVKLTFPFAQRDTLLVGVG